MMKKQTLAVAAILAALGAGAVGVGTTLAAEKMERPAPFSDLVTALAERFSLNEDEVQAVFDEHRPEIRDVMFERHGGGAGPGMKLDAAVTNGDLTQEQADALKAKLEELHAARPDIENLTPEEMKAEVEANMAELKTWAEANGIPEDFLPVHHVFVGRGPAGGEKMLRVDMEMEAGSTAAVNE